MSAIKNSARIIVAAATLLGFASSCGELLGDYIVEKPSLLPAPDAGPPPPPVEEVICEPGTTACAGLALQLCSDDGKEWATLEICATVDLCETSDNSTVSGCLKPKCAVDQMSCDENVLRLCNEMRTGWELFDTCQSPAHCDAGNKQCLPVPCEPGARRCNVGNLERCNDARTGWEPLATCETNELCEATIAPPTVVGEVLSVNDIMIPSPMADDEGPIECLQPVCVPKEVRCDENRLIACTPGQTALTLAEECATPKLCDASITYTGLRGSPRCVRPTCAQGEHRCTDAGVLEVCNADRDGYDPIEACIGAPFCNAVAADNGLPGCEDAPCEAGEMQCNGPQIQRCTDDRTRFEPVGLPCETRGLCNDDNDRNAFCQAPVCQRGAFSGSEFRCEGATLRRCNDQHTGYDLFNTCATAGLCNAALGFAGCQPPVCFPGETRCNGNFVQRCNDQRTGFENFEQCAAGTCDSTLGRCADPCVVGIPRCNAQGNLEECRDPLVGRQVTARCGSPQLCDANTRQCRTPPAGCTADGVRRCRQQGQATVLEECTDGRSRFVTLDTCEGGEVCDPNDIRCDQCVQGSQPTCEGSNLVTCAANGQAETPLPCPNGCQSIDATADRCRNCEPGSVACEGRQLVVCRQRNGTEVIDREDCDTNALCQQTIQSCTGENCHCQTSVCDPGERRCNGGQPEVCNAGQTAFVPDGANCGAGNCNSQTGTCFPCALGDVSCRNGSLFGCAADRSGFTQLLGSQRCVTDNIGDRLQSCNNNQLVDSRCPGGSPICVTGSGCQECNPNDFDSECTTVGGVAARTVCFNGDIQPDECAGEGDCVDAVCQGAGFCNTKSSAAGSACTRAGGRGVCDGAPDPSCVECLSDRDCGDDGNQCTTAFCDTQSRTCRQRAVTCPSDGQFCNGTEACNPATGMCASAGAPSCDDGDPCTDDRCDPARGGACVHDARCTAPGEVCESGRCIQTGCSSDLECADTDPCNGTERCNLTTRGCEPGTPLTCNDGVSCTTDSCVPGRGCNFAPVICPAPTTCQGGVCVAPEPECDPADCAATDPNPLDCTVRVCGAGNECVEAPARDQSSCTENGVAGTCVDQICTVPEPPDPSNGNPGGGNGNPDPGGGNPNPGDPGGGNGNGGGNPGGGNGGIFCDGVCDGLLDVLCPADCQ